MQRAGLSARHAHGASGMYSAPRVFRGYELEEVFYIVYAFLDSYFIWGRDTVITNRLEAAGQPGKC
jgi:hypothetical protein